jgi:hypothetical protein
MKTKNKHLVKSKKVRKSKKIRKNVKGGAFRDTSLKSILSNLPSLSKSPPLVEIKAKLKVLLDGFDNLKKIIPHGFSEIIVYESLVKQLIVLVDKLNTEPSNNLDKSSSRPRDDLVALLEKLRKLISLLQKNSSQESTSLSKKMMAFINKHNEKYNIDAKLIIDGKLFSKYLIETYLKTPSFLLNSVLFKLQDLNNGRTVVDINKIPSELAATISSLILMNKIITQLSNIGKTVVNTNMNFTNTHLMDFMTIHFMKIMEEVKHIIDTIKTFPEFKNLQFSHKEFAELDQMVNSYSKPSKMYSRTQYLANEAKKRRLSLGGLKKNFVSKEYVAPETVEFNAVNYPYSPVEFGNNEYEASSAANVLNPK